MTSNLPPPLSRCAAVTFLLPQFEKGLGCLLRNVWDHVEALQTTDLPALIGHITTVFTDAADK
jgi:hypothetical protein